MKRGCEEVEDANATSSDDLAKKQKASNDEIQLLNPQSELMPRIPAVPPEAPLTEAAQAELKRKYRFKWQTIPPKVYGPEDKKLWPEIASSVFRTQVNIHNSEHASNYMRGWFSEHEGLRAPPPKAPRSAYSLYFNEQKTGWTGKWNQKRDAKKIGAAWKALDEKDQQVYRTKYAKMVAQYQTNNDFWNADAEKWAAQRNEARKGEDPEKLARKYGMSADDFYFYKWW